MSLNKVMLLGNVGQDPQIRSTQDGKKIASFSLATSEKWNDKRTGEQKEITQWHKVVVFSDGLSGIVEKFVKKGSKLYVEGTLETREWTDKDGTKKQVTEVVLKGFNCKIKILDGRNTSETADKQPVGIEDDIPF